MYYFVAIQEEKRQAGGPLILPAEAFFLFLVRTPVAMPV